MKRQFQNRNCSILKRSGSPLHFLLVGALTDDSTDFLPKLFKFRLKLKIRPKPRPKGVT